MIGLFAYFKVVSGERHFRNPKKNERTVAICKSSLRKPNERVTQAH
jgi:hypothetical protein